MTSAALRDQWIPGLDAWRTEYVLTPLALFLFVLLTAPGPQSILASLCLPPTDSTTQRLATLVSIARQSGLWQSALLHWLGMVLAMVPLLALPAVRFVAVRSFAHRRARAVLLFLAAAVGLWLLIGIVPVGLQLFAPLSARDHATLAAAGFVLAAGWQVSPWKRRALRACHRTAPLAASGWRADVHCLQFGWRYAWRCIGSCWALMLACMLAGHQLLFMACMLWIAFHERADDRVRQHVSVLALLGCALISLMPRLLA